MRKLPALCVGLLLFVMGASTADADDATVGSTVKAAFAALDDAFARQDGDAIRRATTPDHVAITPYYGAPKSVAEQIALLPDLKLKETPLSEVEVTLFGADAAAITLTAKNVGTFKGRPLPSPVFVTAIYVKHNGQWLERLYQSTVLKP